MPCLASGACTMSGRGLWIAVPQSAAGGSSQNDSSSHKGHRASSTIYGSCFGVGHIAEVTSDRTNLSPFTKDYRGAASWMRLWSNFCPPRGGKTERLPCPITSRRASSHPYRDRRGLRPGCWAGSRPSVTQVGTKATRIWRLCVTLGLSRASRVCPIQGSGQYWGLREGAGLRVV